MQNPNQVNDDVVMAYKEMFLTEGWKLLCEDFRKNLDTIGPTIVSGMPNIEYVYFIKGKADVWQYVSGLQDFIESVQRLENE
jgi:putative heme iron utilization protein